MSEYVNPWGRTVTAQRSPAVSKIQPAAPIKALLKVKCRSCDSLMSTVLEDADGDLWLHSTDRLREYTAGEDGKVGTFGDYWTLGELTPVTNMDEWQVSGCRKAKYRECGRAYSWQPVEYRSELAKARSISRAQTVSL